MLRAAASLAATVLALVAAPAPTPLDRLNVEAAWKQTKGSSVTVAVLHQRVDADAPELRGRVVQAPDMTGTYYSGPDTRSGPYGTALATLIAGDGSGDGVLGVAPEARILSVPVFAPPLDDELIDPQAGNGGMVDSPIARGIRYAANHGAQVILVPVGTFGVARIDRDAVSYALSRGVSVVSGVGDYGQSPYAREMSTSYWQFPAGYPGVIGVAAVDAKNAGAPFSSDNLSVLVGAPGVEIPVAGGRKLTSTGSASALVAGVVALIKAKYPDLPPDLVSRALTSATRTRPPAGYDDKIGFGVVNAEAALAQAGELASYRRAVEISGDLHFGGGPLSEGPTRPGPDPVRLWVYGIGVMLGLGAFGVSVILLARRGS
ncbi:type VII secretion-associated serine protease mycosin [Acrocarpospora macrocephala]|uniref:Type VII secretion-associated serine protease n=1 Tax=Acrocarpospora macrocephala TaxID=150177 RepID=A0A5M3X6M5_9ACTN|nr:S8 family serine peptidase [Acrocarpospora macrocephala]GES14523.1 type VII secretion-associated serine protease [Acrocarpospora macrocephala]